MEVKIPTTGKPCTKCNEYDGNPLHAGVCNVCYSNALFGDPAKYNRPVPQTSQAPARVSVVEHSAAFENIKLIAGILFGLFLLWMMFGGLLEDQSSYDAQNTVNIDCRQSGWSNSPYCNGEYESQMQQQDANENNYYQNVVR